jgi:hypothetical protein
VDEAVKRYWYEKYRKAEQFMQGRRFRPSVLIEIAAQHPLKDGTIPGPEFAARLDRGRELFREYSTDGRLVEVYVPGSRHMHHGRVDKVSLSAAGCQYLAAAGLPAATLHGEDLNGVYKDQDGVYGSADECFVAASYFRDQGFGTLLSVVSPAQLLRKTLHYIEFGVLPLNITVPTVDGYHNYLDEVFERIPHVLTSDPSQQGAESEERSRLRAERRPDSAAPPFGER